MRADITVFNPETIIDKSTFDNAHQYSEGVEYVVVNGTVVLEQGEHPAPGRERSCMVQGRGTRAA